MSIFHDIISLIISRRKDWMMPESAKQRRARAARRPERTTEEKLFHAAKLSIAYAIRGTSHTHAATMLEWIKGAVQRCLDSGKSTLTFSGDKTAAVIETYRKLLERYDNEQPKANAAIESIKVMLQKDHSDLRDITIKCQESAIQITVILAMSDTHDV